MAGALESSNQEALDVGAHRQSWWTDYYSRIYASSPRAWLDLSNENVQAQAFGIAIEAAGAIEGRRCLDVGCGNGQLSTGLAGLRANEVVGVDIAPETIAACRARYPHVRWECGSPADPEFISSLGTFDVVFLVEVLQYLDLEATLTVLWESVRPGGRIVAVVPNREDEIVRKTVARFGGMYAPPSVAEVRASVASLPGVDSWACRGMDFQPDQGLVPYAVSAWSSTGELEGSANRLNFAIRKRGATSPAMAEADDDRTVSEETRS